MNRLGMVTPVASGCAESEGELPGEACIGAVVVTYCPDITKLADVIRAIAPQVRRIMVVDNGSPRSSVAELRVTCAQYGEILIELPVNVGIAAAQNRGIAELLREGCDYVLLLDHDSVPAIEMVSELVRADRSLRLSGHAVGAVGPVCEDARTGAQWPFVRLEKGRVRRVACSQSCPVLKTDFLIASGSLIHRETFQTVGMMNEAFFIDHVDTEWCLRASAAGYSLFGVCAARLDHELGDRIVRLWMLRWRAVPVHTPVRMYYMFRNTIQMLVKTPMRWNWRVVHVYRLLQFIVFYSLLVSPRVRYCRAMFYGAVDGVLQRMHRIRRSL